jgi:hypothetical protein
MSAVVNPQESIDLSNLRVNTITDGFYTAKMGSIDCIMDTNNYFNITKMLKQFGENIQSFRDKDPERLDMLLYTYTQLSGQSNDSTNLKLVKNVPKNPQFLGVPSLEIVSAKDIEGYESYPLIMYEINTSLGSPVKGKAKAIQNQVVGVYGCRTVAFAVAMFCCPRFFIEVERQSFSYITKTSRKEKMLLEGNNQDLRLEVCDLKIKLQEISKDIKDTVKKEVRSANVKQTTSIDNLTATTKVYKK